MSDCRFGVSPVNYPDPVGCFSILYSLVYPDPVVLKIVGLIPRQLSLRIYPKLS